MTRSLGLQKEAATNVLGSHICLSQALLQRLVIIDDSVITANCYTNNTIRVPQWTKNIKNDKILLECIGIIEQLESNPQTDVHKDL